MFVFKLFKKKLTVQETDVAVARKRRRQSGQLVLGEFNWVALAIGALGVIIGGVALSRYLTARAQAEWQLVDGLMSATKTLYQNEIVPASNVNQYLISNKATGNARTSGTNIILGNYGNQITVVGDGAGNITITDPGLTHDQCVNFVKAMPVAGYTQVSINGGTAVTTFPVSVSSADSSCSAASNGNSIAVTASN